MNIIPNTIWILWLQGWKESPDIVQACLKSWEMHNPNWTIHALSTINLNNYLDMTELSISAEGKDMPPEAYSDLIRIALLERYGGVWVDSTVYCLKPLDTWLPEKLSSGFFAFAKARRGWMLSSWFIAASQGNYLIQAWRSRVIEYWANQTQRHHYFWFHFLFTDGYKSDPYFRAIWDATPKISADGPHYYAPYEKLSLPVSARDHLLATSPSVPALKLTHKLPAVDYSCDSVLNWLITQAIASDKIPSPLANILVCWQATVESYGTIGGFLALQSLVTHLVGQGAYKVAHTSPDNINIIGSRRIEWQTVSPEFFDICIFTSKSPPANISAQVILPGCLDGINTLGIGIDLLPTTDCHFSDDTAARKVPAEYFGGVAIVAPLNLRRPVRMLKQVPIIGICVHERQQGEFGGYTCLGRIEQTIYEAAKEIASKCGGSIVIIGNNLLHAKLTANAIEKQYADCNLIITSRVHGAMMSLRHLVPFIAIAQNQKEAKLMGLANATSWPYIYQADDIDSAQIASEAAKLLAGGFNKMLSDARTQAVEQANKTLAHIAELIRHKIEQRKA